jgi:hypothetical protein
MEILGVALDMGICMVDMYGGYVWWICIVDMYERVCMNMYEWWVLWSRPVTADVKLILIRQSFDRC